ncbi:MAG: hypothetical protein LUQ11_03745 [Methylococcaceae bacterium]|nr:hypothetical protein [Methylococcaceae bacterium]
MNVSVQTVLKTTVSAVALSFAMANPASAAWVGSDNVLGLGETITNTAANGSKNGWVDNRALNNDAWGMFGSWISFQLTSTATTTVKATAQTATASAPAFTLYRTDVSWIPFGTDATVADWLVPGQTSGGTSGTIHDMSQVAQAGQNGFIWATNKTAGGPGVVETLGYANSGHSYAANSWGQAVNGGANDVSIDNLYESGITGSVDVGSASLTLNNLKAGWYTVFVSGANGTLTGSPIDVSVSSVPVPGAVWLFGSALVGLVGASRRKLVA